MNFHLAKCFSLRATTVQLLAPLMAVMILSRPLRGRPVSVRSAIERPQITPAFSATGEVRPAELDLGPFETEELGSQIITIDFKSSPGFQKQPGRGWVLIFASWQCPPAGHGSSGTGTALALIPRARTIALR
jgi:hypothetical protein